MSILDDKTPTRRDGPMTLAHRDGGPMTVAMVALFLAILALFLAILDGSCRPDPVPAGQPVPVQPPPAEKAT